MARDGSRRVLAAVDSAAAALGLRPGLAAAQAQASVSGLALVNASPEADGRALVALAGWCLRCAPVVQPDPPDGVFLDIAGAAHLLGGEAALLEDLLLRLDRSGLAARTAVADTPGAAWALARHGAQSVTVAPPGRAAAVLAELPVAALRITAETARGLNLLGIERVGQLAGHSRPQLALRFGRDLLDRLDRALGRLPEPLTPLLPPDIPTARIAFAEPVGHPEGLSASLDRLLPELCRALDRGGQGLRRLDAIFRRVDGRPIAIRVATAVPTRDPAHLVRLVRQRLDTVDPGFGIDEITVAATRTESLRERQGDVRAALDPGAGEGDPAALGPLVDRLGMRFGTARVFRLAPVESRYPERSVRRVAPLAPATGASWPATLPRPARILDPPEPITAVAVVPDEPPSAFVWRRVRYVVRRADGPERVRGEWWRCDAEVASLRDYYRVEDGAGRRFWLFRDAPMAAGAKWWLHGRFA